MPPAAFTLSAVARSRVPSEVAASDCGTPICAMPSVPRPACSLQFDPPSPDQCTTVSPAAGEQTRASRVSPPDKVPAAASSTLAGSPLLAAAPGVQGSAATL